MRHVYVGIAASAGSISVLALDQDRQPVVETMLAGPTEVAPWLASRGLRPVVVAVDGAGPPELAALAGWSGAPTHRGSADWPVCLAVRAEEEGVAACAELAWRWHHEPGVLRVLPDVRTWEEGYVVAPPPTRVRLLVEVEATALAEAEAALSAVSGVYFVGRCDEIDT